MGHAARKRKPKRKYAIKPGARLSKKAFSDLVPIMAGLADKSELTPKALLDLARDPTSPAHPHFEWNDTLAGEQYRLVQARFFIRSIEIVIDGAPRTRAFHEVTIVRDVNRFEPTDRIMQSEPLSAQLLMKAKADLRSWRLRYEALRCFSELDDIFSAVDFIGN